MTISTVLHTAISSAKTVMPKTIQSTRSAMALPLSSTAVAYSSSLKSKSLVQDRPREKDLPNRVGDPIAESKTKRFYHDSSTIQPQQKLPIIVKTSTDRTIDPFLGNLLDGFCNGSCFNTGTR